MALNMLSDMQIRAAIKAGQRAKLFDGGGMFLLIDPPRQPGWRLKYRISGREKGMSLGPYADVPLKRAREKRDAARKLISDGRDPSAERQAEKQAKVNSFQAVAADWLDRQARTLAQDTVDIQRGRLTSILNPAFGSTPINEIKAHQLLAVLRSVEARGRHDTAHRVRSLFSRIARYAIATDKAERDVSADLKGALAPVQTEHFAAITDPKRIGELMRSIRGYVGQPSVVYALRLVPLVFVRPGELRGAEWSEFELEGREPVWRIPGARMKMGKAHLVPLSTQAVGVIEGLQPLTGAGRYLFPSLRTPERPISDNTINSALRRMGYGSHEMTGHGFRTLASTRLNELGWSPDIIERQLAHAEQNAVRDAYNRAEKLPERRKMMQAWADHLDVLEAGSDKVVAIKRKVG